MGAGVQDVVSDRLDQVVVQTRNSLTGCIRNVVHSVSLSILIGGQSQAEDIVEYRFLVASTPLAVQAENRRARLPAIPSCNSSILGNFILQSELTSASDVQL